MRKQSKTKRSYVACLYVGSEEYPGPGKTFVVIYYVHTLILFRFNGLPLLSQISNSHSRLHRCFNARPGEYFPPRTNGTNSHGIDVAFDSFEELLLLLLLLRPRHLANNVSAKVSSLENRLLLSLDIIRNS